METEINEFILVIKNELVISNLALPSNDRQPLVRPAVRLSGGSAVRPRGPAEKSLRTDFTGL